MFASLLYGLYSGNRVCYTLFFMQVLILLTALALNLWTILSFSYVQTLNTREAEKGQTVKEDYAKNMMDKVNSKFTYSAKILETDYYGNVVPEDFRETADTTDTKTTP